MPLTMSENAPKLRKLSGNESADKMGLTDPLIKPTNIAAIKAAGKFAMSTPGTTKSTISRLKAVAIVAKNITIIFYPKTKEIGTFKVLSLFSKTCYALTSLAGQMSPMPFGWES
jgi:hypothetical protein